MKIVPEPELVIQVKYVWGINNLNEFLATIPYHLIYKIDKNEANSDAYFVYYITQKPTDNEK